jgi:hypothetical protein
VTLYHFTRAELAKRIEREGITKGLIFDGNYCRRGFIWLTEDHRFTAQHWATNNSGWCGDRTEVRFTVEVPETPALMRWNCAAREVFNLSRAELMQFNMAGGSDGSPWFVYKGVIPRAWINQKMDRAA